MDLVYARVLRSDDEVSGVLSTENERTCVVGSVRHFVDAKMCFVANVGVCVCVCHSRINTLNTIIQPAPVYANKVFKYATSLESGFPFSRAPSTFLFFFSLHGRVIYSLDSPVGIE